jgi:hypothetical protein
MWPRRKILGGKEVSIAFRAKPIEKICGNCEYWRDNFDFDRLGRCPFNVNSTHYNHKCDAEEIKI